MTLMHKDTDQHICKMHLGQKNHGSDKSTTNYRTLQAEYVNILVSTTI